LNFDGSTNLADVDAPRIEIAPALIMRAAFHVWHMNVLLYAVFKDRERPLEATIRSILFGRAAAGALESPCPQS
jgi:hypothetical protein